MSDEMAAFIVAPAKVKAMRDVGLHHWGLELEPQLRQPQDERAGTPGAACIF
jgi:hypothetical protein